MKVTVHQELCEAHGDCVVAAPEIFDLGEDDDWAQVLDETPGEALRAKVELAARSCPVLAITIED